MLFFSSAFAVEVPTLDQVYKAAQSGRMDEAQSMMDIVLKAHPGSAKAHFVEAELLAKQGQLDRADVQLTKAERLNPALSFAKPQAVQDLKNRIAAIHHVSLSQTGNFQPAQGNGFPWGMLLIGGGVIAILFFVMRAINSRKITQDSYQPIAGMQRAVAAQPYGQSYGGGMGTMAATGSGIGSGIMGGLVTGAAVGAGMVAGEALAHHFMDGGRADSMPADSRFDSSANLSSDNMGGSDFGIADNSSWDDGSGIASSSDSDWG